jgi:WD40 repeat protein
MDHFLRIWDLLNNSLVIKIDFAKRFVKSLEMTSDNSRVIVSSSDGNIRIYEIESGKQLAITEGFEEFDAICFDSQSIKIGDFRGT